jgi:predicted hydrocarbon binding protein
LENTKLEASLDTRRVLDRLERLFVVSGINEVECRDLLQLSWRDHSLIRSGKRALPQTILERVATRFEIEPEKLRTGEIDFYSIQTKAEAARNWTIPHKYGIAMHGRARTTMTTFEYIATSYNWRLRYETLRHLQMGESTLRSEYAPISMRFITDALDYLRTRQFQDKDFFAMGVYSYRANVSTILGKLLSELKEPSEIMEHMWGDYLKFFEENCIYRFLELNQESARLEVTSNPHVACEMGVRNLGNPSICSLKAGMMASAPCYIGLPPAHVVESQCVHHGDPSCVFEITFRKRSLSRLS